MRAITYTEYGDADVLHLEEIAKPEPGEGQVRITVRTVGVNPIDWKVRSGGMAQGAPLEGTQIPGTEAAGVVDAVGGGVSFAVGDEVFGWTTDGAYAEYVLASAASIARKPETVSWRVAAALPVAGETALRALKVLNVSEGDVLLIHGASGAVGRVATQLALASGATVVGVGGQGAQDDLTSLGAIPVLYGDGWAGRVREAAPKPVEKVFDAAGYGVLEDSVELVGGKDKVVTIADPAAFGLGITFSAGSADEQLAGVLDEIAERVTSGKLAVVLGKDYPLAEAADAQRESATGHSGGKLTLSVS
ncbi:NADP-dependent oxidoreductase [Amycolatopsis sp. H20-H5]|uniref:NADP-dependent oxidoreductase n=1 Tax=Amycolatopsis sp. H20-H5 TaxID=3046309 RepID=UPI002DBE1DDB|nr:NADP-dependent oxidoreductase [Amycolatopsis sp. H20-H5]MEC3973822.1 NADP-dependent oxidoreductase [Amycolatopsis sp. H20-H5]